MRLASSSPLASPQRGLFRVDLFAKAAAPPGLAQRTSAHPFVIVGGPRGLGGCASNIHTNNTNNTDMMTDNPCFLFAAADEDAFFDRLRALDVLARGGAAFWVDVDLSALGAGRYGELCELLHLHDVTRRDCIVEDTSVTDTKISYYQHYLFLIVDTLLLQAEAQAEARAGARAGATGGAEENAQHAEWETRNLNIILYERACVTLHNGPMPGPAAILARIQDFHAGRKSIPCAATLT
jgi:Mg2+ and Co2+ transporter CorA